MPDPNKLPNFPYPCTRIKTYERQLHRNMTVIPTTLATGKLKRGMHVAQSFTEMDCNGLYSQYNTPPGESQNEWGRSTQARQKISTGASSKNRISGAAARLIPPEVIYYYT